MTIANTISSTTIKQIRSKVNEIIGVVNTLGTGNVSNTYLQQIIANTNSYIATKTNESASLARLANTNSYIATKTNESVSRSRLANTNAYIATKVNTSTFNAALANTNAYIAYVQAHAGTGTGNVSNTYLQQIVANTNSYIATKVNTSTFNAALANTNAYIQSISLAANATYINNAPSATGSSLIFNRINSTVYFKRIKAGRNIVISEHNGDLILTAIEQRDYGYVNNDFGSITNPPDTNNLYDYGSI